MIKKIIVILITYILSLNLLFCASNYICSEDKRKVKRIITEIKEISSNSKSLDDFGRKTMKHGVEIMRIGETAVYALSLYTTHPDWKVRFWIVDMLGYLNNPDAKRPLIRILRNEHEKDIVYERAWKSLKSLDNKNYINLMKKNRDQIIER